MPRPTVKTIHQIRAHMPPLPRSNALGLASCYPAANRRQPTDRRGVSPACLERTQIHSEVLPRQAPALLAPPSLCGDGKAKDKGLQSRPDQPKLPDYRPAKLANSV
ncbi:hypothetical protein PBI_RYAN_40 [Arthrobacter phage Ryan]|uniref:Uncharacterized protein n=1 Tax=Arthrobacter phage Ryan TaxID=2419968 RepID=A0A3G2KJ96_9CAUD|nr:hypothetical protein QEO75_gp69 [Arthrobacter phage Ryan]AYN59064.1 hypothetical protein PBI_RYAN_40 [Arthrobacter phage Ryan]